MIPTLFLLSAVGGFFSGLLGVGGAIVLIPLMLSVPPIVGVGQLTMNEVAGITMVQVLAASISGCLAHRRDGFAHVKMVLTMGIPMGLCSLGGALLSRSMQGRSMLILFGVLVIVALVMLLMRKTPDEAGEEQQEFELNAPLAATIGGAVGIASGIVGAGGGFVLIPVMITVLKVPMRIAVGSSLGVVFIGALMGSVGKIVSLQVEWVYLLPVLLGSVPGARLGARVSKMLPTAHIRYGLIIVVVLTLIKTWTDILSPVFLALR